jgi:hypothetical protein
MTRPRSEHTQWHRGPLLGHPRRRMIATSVRHGQAVDRQGDAEVAMAYSRWMIGNYEIGGVVALVVGILSMTAGDAGGISVAVGAVLVAIAASCLVLGLNARRAFTLNEDLLAAGRP